MFTTLTISKNCRSSAVGFAVRWKSTFQHVRMSVCPENVGNWSSSPQNESGSFFSKIYPELFPAPPRAQFQEITVSTFSIQLGQIRLQLSIGSKKKNVFSIQSEIVIVLHPVGPRKCRPWFPATGPLEKRETAWIDSEKAPTPSEARKTNFQHFRGQKLMRTYWNVLFQRTCKANVA